MITKQSSYYFLTETHKTGIFNDDSVERHKCKKTHKFQQGIPPAAARREASANISLKEIVPSLGVKAYQEVT